MTDPTFSAATNLKSSRSRIARLWRRLERQHRRMAAAPTPAPPVFRHVWQEVAPGQWRWIHIRVDDQDMPS
jgi:hypothetical protein